MFTYFTISSLGFSPSPDQAHCQGWAQYIDEPEPSQALARPWASGPQPTHHYSHWFSRPHLIRLSEWDPCQNLEFLPKCVPGPAQGLQLDLFCKGNGKVKVSAFLKILMLGGQSSFICSFGKNWSKCIHH
jgi:hypothetical protein